MKIRNLILTGTLLFSVLVSTSVNAQIGTRFPSEKKIVTDTVTGTRLTFLTSKPAGDSKIYQTHRQWTADGNWLIFRSNRVPGETLAVNEKTGDIVQVSEGGYMGMLSVAQKSMKLYFLRMVLRQVGQTRGGPVQLVEVDLEKLFADSEAGKLKRENEYQRVCGTIPPEIEAGGDLALDSDEEWVYFRVGKGETAKHLPAGTKTESSYGPGNMGAGPSGIGSMNIKTREVKFIVAVPFQIGHIQANPSVPGEIVFCCETGDKAPQRTWTVMSDGTGLRPLYPESEYVWVTNEAVITREEVAIAIKGYVSVGTGPTPSAGGLWHVNGSADGRWVAGDDFARNIYLIDRHTHEMILLSAGHKITASDHPHPTFSPDGTRIEIQSAMLSENNRSMNICIIPVPEDWLNRILKRELH